MDLSERLSRIIGQKELAQTPAATPIEGLLEGDWIEHGKARVFVRVASRGWKAKGGLEGVSRLHGTTFGPHSSLLFLDTETTGLAGGTGTFAFMVGLGYYENERFTVVQLFMPKFSDEQALLAELRRYLERYEHLTTFNGRTFDVPLLETRFALQRERNPFSGKNHIDLLHLSRAIWKRRLESCSLQSLEANIFGMVREDDIPGELIPEVYFRFVRTGDGQQMKRVFLHNEQDIVSMMSLIEVVSSVLEDPNSRHFNDPVEQLSVGLYLAKKGLVKESMDFFEKATNTSNGQLKDEALLALGNLCKRQRDFNTAHEHFTKVRHSTLHLLTSLEEQAKHLEHRLKDLDAALEATNHALDVCKQNKMLGVHIPVNVAEGLVKRKNRLVVKKNRLGL